MGLLRAWAAVESWAAAAKLGVIAELIRRDGPPPHDGYHDGYHGDLPDAWSPSLRHELALALACPVQSAETTAWLAWEQQARLRGIGALLCGSAVRPRLVVACWCGWKYWTSARESAMAPREQDEFPAEFHRERREHGGASQRLNDDQLAELTEEERVAAGLDAYDPDEVPPATDTPPDPEDPRLDEVYEGERAELFREIDNGEFHDISKDNPFPPTRYDDPGRPSA